MPYSKHSQALAVSEKGDEYKNYWLAGELADHLGVTTRTVRRWVHLGYIEQPEARSRNGWGMWSPQQTRSIRSWFLQRIP